MDDLLALGKQVLQAQPFSLFVGAEITEFSIGHAVIVLPIRAELKQQFGYVHGGAISFVVDNALTFAGGSVLGAQVVTMGFTINYLVPAVGEQLIGRASVIHTSKRHAVCRCDVVAVSGGQETLCATAQGTIAKMSSVE